MPESEDLSIAEVSARTGLTRDTLRWYESEGVIPPVPRTSSGVRRYDDDTIRTIELLVRLRRTGMSVAHMRDFVAMLEQGARTHGRRMRLLRFTTSTTRQKYKNVTGDPRVAISINDPDQPYRYLEVRGVVERIDPDPTGAGFGALADRYGLPMDGPPGDVEHRVVLVVTPTATSHQ